MLNDGFGKAKIGDNAIPLMAKSPSASEKMATDPSPSDWEALESTLTSTYAVREAESGIAFTRMIGSSYNTNIADTNEKIFFATGHDDSGRDAAVIDQPFNLWPSCQYESGERMDEF